jgi:hypothetical protein
MRLNVIGERGSNSCMPSQARKKWLTSRQAALDRLIASHGTITRGRPGRQWETEHMNFALITRLAAEFQGYFRDLHDESVDHVTANLGAAPGSGLLLITRSAFIQDRLLDRGNPNWSNLARDFKRIGLDMPESLKRTYPTQYPEWETTVGCLMEARNAIAHSNDKEIRQCRQKQPRTLPTFRRWRGSLGLTPFGGHRVRRLLPSE